MRWIGERAFGLTRAALLAAGIGAMTAGGAAAQDTPRQGWTFKGELTSVLSGGNGETLTFGLGSQIENRRGPNQWRFEAGGVRTEATRITRRAVGTADDFAILDEEERRKTAEAYFARTRYDRQLSERFFAFGGLDWLRNTFAGVDSRFLTAVGAGNTWVDTDVTRFKTNYAVTYTFQSDVVENPFVKSSFPGLRTGWEFFRQATSTTEFESSLVADLSLDETDDLRLDLTNSLNVAVSSALALKPSLQVLWKNLPSYTEVDLFTPGGTPVGTKVLTPLRKLDYFFKLALVVKL
jgi:hypothetical protein